MDKRIIIVILCLALFIETFVLGVTWKSGSHLEKELTEAKMETLVVKKKMDGMGKKVDKLHAHTLKLESHYQTYLMWSSMERGPAETRESLKKFRAFTGIGGGINNGNE